MIESLGAFREAQGGTLLITDIEELEGEALSALPRALANQELLALEQGEELRVRLVISGGPKAERALSSALQSTIGEEVLQLPPLSHRLEDLGSLVSVFLERFEAVESVKLRRSVARALVLHDWPGGVGELEAAIAQCVSLAGDDNIIRLSHLPKQVQAKRGESTARQRRSVISHLQATSGNISAAARLMGITRAQLHRLAKRHGVDLPSLAKKAKNDE